MYVSVGCWDPAICGNPAAFWSGLGLDVPKVEPPSDDFSSTGVLLFDWAHDPPSWFHDTLWHHDLIPTPEPSTLVLFLTALVLGVLAKISRFFS